MDENTTYYEVLIARYLSGEATPGELSALSAWLMEDAGNQRFFREIRNSWALQQAMHVEDAVDPETEWEAMARKIGIAERPVSRTLGKRTRRYMIGAAALALLLILPSVIYFLFFMQAREDVLAAEDHVVESVLPDGTSVALNSGAVLHFPTRFTGKERKVSLEGEAYFDVVHNEKKAFVIEADDMQLRVLGTSFYVNTHAAGNTMEVVLISGSVQIEYNGRQMVLEPGEKAVVLRQEGEIVKQPHSDPNLLAWKTRKLSFDNTPMSRIVELLEKVYHKEIVVMNPEINNCRITATFEGQSLEAVLLVLQSTIDITARPRGDTVELSGTGCQQ